MSESIKKRINHSHLGNMSNKELKKLLDAALADLTAIRTQVNDIAADMANVQIVTNNLVSAIGNIDVNCANAVLNLNAVTLSGVADMAALTLTA